MSSTPVNRLRGIVQSVTYTGGNAHVVLEGTAGEQFTTTLPTATAERLDLCPGDEFEATVHVTEVAANGRRAQSVVRMPAVANEIGVHPGRTPV